MSFECGLNYEGGKIIKHILQHEDCLAYTNVQIRMDAPWSGEVANICQRLSPDRDLGPYETQLPGYNERKSQMVNKLSDVFHKAENLILSFGNVGHLVIQIARGKACRWFIPDIIAPIIKTLQPEIQSMVKLVTGYRKIDYYNHNSHDGPFVFINIGMFAAVTSTDLVEVCVPVLTLDLELKNSHLSVHQRNQHYDDFGIKLGLTPMILGGIPDHAPFIESNQYEYSAICALFDGIYLR